MFNHSMRRKAHRSLFADSKGFSSIVGAIFAVLIMFSLMSTVFVWSLSQNTMYNNAMRQNRQLDLDRSNEEITANVTCLPVGSNNDTVAINGTLENSGPLAVQIVTAWATDFNKQTYAYNSSLNIVLKPGSTATLVFGTNATLIKLDNSPGDSLGCWFVTARGNTISESDLYTTVVNNYGNGTEVPPFAYVSGGIGSISMDFSSFSHYDGVPNINGTSVGSPVYAYSLSGSINTLLHVKVTNYDLYNRTLRLTGGSMWAITPFSGTLKGDLWKIANVTGGKLITTSTYSQNINYKQTVDLYFGPETASRSAGNIVPLFILLYGQATFTNGTTIDYGQNLPFIALNVT